MRFPFPPLLPVSAQKYNHIIRKLTIKVLLYHLCILLLFEKLFDIFLVMRQVKTINDNELGKIYFKHPITYVDK